MARRGPGDYDLAFSVGNAVIRRIQRNHDRAHLSMNIAKNERNSRTIETYITRASSFVETKVESLALKQRKHIVKKRIAIGKLDHGPDWHHKQVRLEALVVLH